MKRILVGSPIRQEPTTLNLFLESLSKLNKEGIEVDYCFVDDNEVEESKELLLNFSQNYNVKFIEPPVISKEKYIKDDRTHYWTPVLINKVAVSKNKIIEYMLQQDYDYMFFIDSDLVLHEDTLLSLMKADKDIVSEIFWTKWSPDSIELPQVWLKDHYTLYDVKPGENPTPQELNIRALNFVNMLRTPGVYEVGGLGALTLIKRRVFESGVNFDNIKNISFMGEDRHFCIRAAVHGFGLFVDTHYPAYHIYRKSDLDKLLQKR